MDFGGLLVLCAFRQRQGVGVGSITESLGIPLTRLSHLGLIGTQGFFFLSDGTAVYRFAHRLLPIIATFNFMMQDYH